MKKILVPFDFTFPSENTLRANYVVAARKHRGHFERLAAYSAWFRSGVLEALLYIAQLCYQRLFLTSQVEHPV